MNWFISFRYPSFLAKHSIGCDQCHTSLGIQDAYESTRRISLLKFFAVDSVIKTAMARAFYDFSFLIYFVSYLSRLSSL